MYANYKPKEAAFLIKDDLFWRRIADLQSKPFW